LKKKLVVAFYPDMKIPAYDYVLGPKEIEEKAQLCNQNNYKLV